MTAETIARKWHDRLISEVSVDHDAAEAAIGAVYRAANLPAPKRFLWCASPLDAAWAAVLLIGKTDGFNHAVLEDVARSKSGKAKIADARSRGRRASRHRRGGYRRRVSEAPFYRAEGFDPVAKQLMEDNASSWMARAEAGDDYLAVHSQGPFKPLHDLEQALHFEGYLLSRRRQRQGSLYNQALAADRRQANRDPRRPLGASSAVRQHSLSSSARSTKRWRRPASSSRPLSSARCGRRTSACGMWWPCRGGVVLAERPVAADTRPPTAQRIEWADGFALGGKPGRQPPLAPRHRPLRPNVRSTPAVLDILPTPLPRDHRRAHRRPARAGRRFAPFRPLSRRRA